LHPGGIQSRDPADREKAELEQGVNKGGRRGVNFAAPQRGLHDHGKHSPEDIKGCEHNHRNEHVGQQAHKKIAYRGRIEDSPETGNDIGDKWIHSCLLANNHRSLLPSDTQFFRTLEGVRIIGYSCRAIERRLKSALYNLLNFIQS